MDPLRPFLSLVRSLWTGKATAQAVTRSQAAASPPSTPHAAALAASQPIELRLQAQLKSFAAPGAWNAQRAREVFVRQVLLNEFGEELAADPAFSELIQRVNGQLGGDPRVSGRLDELLREIAARA